MTDKTKILFISGAVAGASLLYYSGKSALEAQQLSKQYNVDFATAWQIPDSALPYLEALQNAEKEYNLPNGLLVRVAYQESRFRPEIINGSLQSGAGAIGIMQIVPKWHPDVNPYDPFDSIDYAAKYLRRLHNQFGSWELALAAYNWGPGNVGKSPYFDEWPKETRDYVTQISSDVRLV